MSLPQTDNFNRAFQYPLAGNWTTSPGFGALTGYNNAVCTQTTIWSSTYWNADTFGNDQYSLCLVLKPEWCGPAVRIASAGTGNGYYIFAGATPPNGVCVFKVVDGVNTQLGSEISRTNADNEIWKLSVSGTTLTPNVGGSDLSTRTDSSLASGSAGMMIYSTYGSGVYLDDWEGGDMPASGYLLTCDAGSFVETGQPVSLLKSSLINASPGTYNLTGTAVALLASRSLITESGGYAITGADVSFLRSYLLSAGIGSFILTGQDVTLTFTGVGIYALTCDAGTFNITGQVASLFYSRVIGADAGTFILTGSLAPLLYHRVVQAELGDYAINGQSCYLLHQKILVAEIGNYLLTGQDVTLILIPVGAAEYVLVCDEGLFVLTGKTVKLKRSQVMAVADGTHAPVSMTIVEGGIPLSSLNLIHGTHPLNEMIIEEG
jgi:hypothetical protein